MRMESEGGLHTELKKIFQIFRDFLTGVTKLEELGAVGSGLLTGFQQGLEFLRRPPINSTSELIKNIIKANETKRVKSYVEASYINSHDSVQNLSKLHTCLLGLHGHLSKAKSTLSELECLLEDITGAMQTANECFSPLWDKDLGDSWDRQATTDKEEMTSSCLKELEMVDYAILMGIIYNMVKRDYEMQERIVTSLNLNSLSGELESYCLMWSLRPFINDEMMHQVWRRIP